MMKMAMMKKKKSMMKKMTMKISVRIPLLVGRGKGSPIITTPMTKISVRIKKYGLAEGAFYFL